MPSKPPRTPSSPGSRRSGTEPSDAIPDPPTPPSLPAQETGTRGSHNADPQQPASDAPGTAFQQILLPATVFQVRIGISSSLIDGETIVVDSLENRFFRLNASGSFVWQKLYPEATLEEITAGIAQEYDLDEQTARESVKTFLSDLFEAGLVVFSTRPDDEVIPHE